LLPTAEWKIREILQARQVFGDDISERAASAFVLMLLAMAEGVITFGDIHPAFD